MRPERDDGRRGIGDAGNRVGLVGGEGHPAGGGDDRPVGRADGGGADGDQHRTGDRLLDLAVGIAGGAGRLVGAVIFSELIDAGRNQAHGLVEGGGRADAAVAAELVGTAGTEAGELAVGPVINALHLGVGFFVVEKVGDIELAHREGMYQGAIFLPTDRLDDVHLIVVGVAGPHADQAADALFEKVRHG